jgi:GNAT superfamily N-acetyltransferase
MIKGMVENPMSESYPLVAPTFRFATVEDIALINELDSFSSSPTRDIHREMEKYFGSVDPSTHERTLIFLTEIEGRAVAKAELMLPPPAEAANSVGYIKRVIVRPDFRVHGVARQLLRHLLAYAHDELHLAAVDLHVWEGNQPAVRLYQSLGFELQHRELYFRLPL